VADITCERYDLGEYFAASGHCICICRQGNARSRSKDFVEQLLLNLIDLSNHSAVAKVSALDADFFDHCYETVQGSQAGFSTTT
jgi:hypothetical protein